MADVGDWVRFYRNGELVIGVVEYRRGPMAWERTDYLITTVGEVSEGRVLEVRRKGEE